MCILCGVDSGQDYFCKPCWSNSPMSIKDSWWSLIDYGRVTPADNQIEVFVKWAMIRLSEQAT